MIGFDKDIYNRGYKSFQDNADIEPPPPGEYVSVVKALEDKVQDDGKRYIQALLVVDEGEFEGKKIRVRYYYQSEIGMGKFLGLCAAAGFTPDPARPGVDETKVIGRKVVAVMRTTTNKKNGNTYVELSYAKPFDPNAVAKTPDVDAPFVG